MPVAKSGIVVAKLRIICYLFLAIFQMLYLLKDFDYFTLLPYYPITLLPYYPITLLPY
jgi:hypothetical protein